VSQVTAAQIRRVAREFFQPRHVSLAMVSPRKSDKGVADLIRL